MFDGTFKPNPEDSLHYCLLLGDGDINDRGEGDEGFNTPVCRPRGVQKTLKRGPSPSQDRACAKTGFLLTARSSIGAGYRPFKAERWVRFPYELLETFQSERGEVWLSHLVGGQGIVGSNPTVLTDKRDVG